MTLGSNGLFLRAGEARAQYENSTSNEVEQMNDVTGILKEVAIQNGLEPVDRTGIAVGDYIDYTPDIVGAYPASKLAKSITGSDRNTRDISQDTNMKWQILKINNDGSMDIIGTPTSKGITFSGALGYNNGVYVLNDICKDLYSKNSKGIVARSVKLEDYENWLTPEGKAARDNYGKGNIYEYNKTNQYKKTDWLNCNTYRPDIFEKTNDKSDIGYDEPPTTNTSSGRGSILEVKQTCYWIPVNETNFGAAYKILNTGNTYSWMASRGVGCGSNYACFRLFFYGQRYQ